MESAQMLKRVNYKHKCSMNCHIIKTKNCNSQHRSKQASKTTDTDSMFAESIYIEGTEEKFQIRGKENKKRKVGLVGVDSAVWSVAEGYEFFEFALEDFVGVCVEVGAVFVDQFSDDFHV